MTSAFSHSGQARKSKGRRILLGAAPDEQSRPNTTHDATRCAGSGPLHRKGKDNAQCQQGAIKMKFAKTLTAVVLAAGFAFSAQAADKMKIAMVVKTLGNGFFDA